MAPEALKSLYPNLGEETLAAAVENLDRYVLLAWEIMEGQSTQPELEATRDELYHPNKGRIETSESPKP